MNVQDAPAVVTKGRFAELKNVTPGRVSQWIAEGKIGPDALDGEGRSARIKVAVANAQLRRTLDPIQLAANGLDTRLGAVSPPPDAAPASSARPDGPAVDPVEEQIKRARLESLQAQNRKLAEEEAARSGRYVDAEQAAQQMGRIAGSMLTVFEGSLTELATALAAKFKVPQRDALHLLRAEFRVIRERAAASMAQAAAAMPALIEAATEDEATGEAEPPDAE